MYGIHLSKREKMMIIIIIMIIIMIVIIIIITKKLKNYKNIFLIGVDLVLINDNDNNYVN